MILRIFFILLMVFANLTSIPTKALSKSDPVDTMQRDEVTLAIGELESLKVYGLTRISLIDPNIVDILDADDKQINIIARTAGQTAMFIWDENGKKTILINVVSQDLKMTMTRIQDLFKSSGISEVKLALNAKEGKIVLTGDLPAQKKDTFTQITDPFKASLINFVKPGDIEDMVQIDMQITELSESLQKSLGFNWSTGTDSLIFKYEENFPGFDGSVGDYFKIGDFERTTPIIATIDALVVQGKGHILSKPKLVVVSGKDASFNVGGEVPIRTLTSSQNTTTESFSFRSYGVGMTITPTIKRKKIDISMTVNISDIDAGNSISGQAAAFTTRTAQTKLILDDQQTIVLAGLIKKSNSEKIQKVPFLGDVPLVGLLFRKKSNPVADQDTEVVISLTPTIINQKPDPIEVEPVSVPVVEQDSMANDSAMNKDQATLENNVQQLSENNAVNEAADQSMPSLGTEEDVLGALEEDVTDPNSSASTSEEPMVATPENVSEIMKNYVKDVQNKISQAIVYPSEAAQAGWEGTVKLSLTILKDGMLEQVSVKESSGHDIFDEYAVNTAKNVAPFSSFPAGVDLQEVNVTIPIVYSLNTN